MAIRFDGSADSVSRTTDLPSDTVFSISFWTYIDVDRNAYSAFVDRTNGANELILSTYTDGTTLSLWTGTDNTGSALSTGTWYHIGWTRATDDHVVYLNGVSDITVTTTIGGATSFLMGNDAFSEWFNGRIAYVKMWSGATLTADEIRAEMWSARAQRRTNLYAEWPMLHGATERLRDYSGNGRNLTANGTLADNDGPPVSWGGQYMSYIFPTGADTALAGAITGQATVAGDLTTQITLAGSINGVGNVAGDLTTSISLASSISAVATLSADLTTQISLASSISGVASLSGTLLTADTALAGAITAQATVAGDLTTAIRMAAAISAQASASASLTVGGIGTIDGSFTDVINTNYGSINLYCIKDGNSTYYKW